MLSDELGTSKNRLAVDREFMYVGLAGPGRAEGRADGRADGRTDGRKGRFEAQVPIFTASKQKCVRKMQKKT